MIIVPIITITFHQVTCRQVSEAIWSRALSTNWSGSRWRGPWGKFLIISSANIITSSFYHYPSEGGLLCFSIIIAMLNWVKARKKFDATLKLRQAMRGQARFLETVRGAPRRRLDLPGL